MMDVLRSIERWQYDLTCPGDIFVFSKTPKNYIEHTNLVLHIIEDAGVTLILKHFYFYKSHTTYLRHEIKSKKPEMASHSTDFISNLKVLIAGD